VCVRRTLSSVVYCIIRVRIVCHACPTARLTNFFRYGLVLRESYGTPSCSALSADLNATWRACTCQNDPWHVQSNEHDWEETNRLTQTHPPGLDPNIGRAPFARSTTPIMHTTHQSMSPSNAASCFGLSLTQLPRWNASQAIATTDESMMAESRWARSCSGACEGSSARATRVAKRTLLESAIEIDRVGDEVPWEL
jgi:hypothetical protein